ncbi:MAG TPA: efflux RND transporter periplasmic adaptor subunit [Gemmatimonadales bacterium]|nr:efflux RND transporter periplasmic adaptor subunit [Gemmatimonadales bacterium]
MSDRNPIKSLLTRSYRGLLTLALVAAAVFVGRRIWVHYEVEPRTRDGKVRVDVVAVAADVAGRVTAVPVHDNQAVRRGEVLFVVDSTRYALAVQQAAAARATARAARDQARIEARRTGALADVLAQQVWQQAATQARQAEAAYAQAEANLALARLNLERAVVTAPVDGIVTNLTLRPGAYVAVGAPVLALVDRHSVYVAGYFEETKLRRIHVGDLAEVRLMGEARVLRGHVESVALAVEDRERTTGTQLLPNVNPAFPWVRLAQRVPVRIALDELPDDVTLVAGRSASIDILPDSATARPPRVALEEAGR